MPKTRILIVDDDPAIRKLLNANLRAAGYEVEQAGDGAEALQKFEMNLPGLVILDIMMPRLDGAEVCRRLREWSQVPIIMLSARGDPEDKVICLNLGADDYITKPFGVNELLARVSAVLRRSQAVRETPALPELKVDDLVVNFAERRVTRGGRVLRLTPTEYNLLRELALNANKVLTHRELLNRVWGPEYGEEREYLHVFIGRLRQELGEDRAHGFIVTVPGVGYQFRA